MPLWVHFKPKIGWKMMRKRESKKYHYGFISSQNRMENAGKERIKKVSFRFVPTRREIENSKEIAKKLKKLKNTVMASFRAKNRLENEEKETK